MQVYNTSIIKWTSVWKVTQKSYGFLSGIGEVIDITALKHTKFNSYLSNSIKVILKTKKDDEIPSTININDVKVALMRSGGRVNPKVGDFAGREESVEELVNLGNKEYSDIEKNHLEQIITPEDSVGSVETTTMKIEFNNSEVMDEE
ncbi:hypothetical protein AYI70_g2323 [Smittium culicis]|uniref:Uncharacterized protein n=1 Tax=Smittium culicis TaxID=133412 RepID=A0A1R1Y911_9FUNG|nr:hypothetical protein AYI70_g2323 [Smittium culicis]